MKNDFRTVKSAVISAIKDIDKRDENWKWKAIVQKSQVKIFWSYLEYIGAKEPFVITDGSPEKGECSNESNFIVARNEQGDFISGRTVGYGPYDDGSLEKCTLLLMKCIKSMADKCY